LVIRKRPGIPMPSGRGAAEDQSVPHDPPAKGLTTVVQPHQVRRIPERLICAAQLILVLSDNDGSSAADPRSAVTVCDQRSGLGWPCRPACGPCVSGPITVHCGLSTVDGLSFSLSINRRRQAPRMPHLPLWRPRLAGLDMQGQRVTDLRIKRLQVRFLSGGPAFIGMTTFALAPIT
jgi:hypothetical protein